MIIDIKKKKPTKINDLLFGIFYEDIGFSADGGMSSELTQNGNFQCQYLKESKKLFKKERIGKIINEPWKSWKIVNGEEFELEMTREHPVVEENPTHLKIKGQGVTILNTGFFPLGAPSDYGMGVVKGNTYRISFYARAIGESTITAYLGTKNNKTVTEKTTFTISSDWNKYQVEVVGKESVDSALLLEIGAGEVEIDFVSVRDLTNVWRADNEYFRELGLRKDMMQALYDLRPRFVRFPGGCIVEGVGPYENAYRWKNTIGDRMKRKGTPNRWGYFQSYDIGFYEFFVICDEIGASAVPMINAGLTCQCFNDKVALRVDCDRDKEAFKTDVIDYAVDLIYFALGDVNASDDREREWAELRASYGHPAPFKMRHLGIGNENWGDAYERNFATVKKALQDVDGRNLIEEYGLSLVIANGVTTKGQGDGTFGVWNFINKEGNQDAIVDEHYYCTPEWFFEKGDSLYDNYDRNSAKVFISEYAAHNKYKKYGRNIKKEEENNTMLTAVAEGAFMTSIERNSDVIDMVAYAPLFAKIRSNVNPERPANWYPNLIWFNARETMRTPNYYVQQMFMETDGETLLDVKSEDKNVYLSATMNEEKRELYVKIAYNGEADVSYEIKIENADVESAKSTTLYGDKLLRNLIDNERVIENVTPTEGAVYVEGNELKVALAPMSVSVVTVKLK